MSDESDNDQAWWMPADRPDPPEPEDVIEMGRMHSTRPIGPMSPRSWSRRPYILTGVAVAALLGGAGAALAATNSPAAPASPSAVAATPAPSPGPSGQPPGRGFHRFGGGFGFGFGGLFGALHGQFVVAKPGGGYQTVDVQTGQVTAVSTTSITLKSTDGFTKSYTVTSSTMVDAQRDGIGSVKVGNQATMLAMVSGSSATAASIADLTLLQQGHAGFGSGREGTSGASSTY